MNGNDSYVRSLLSHGWAWLLVALVVLFNAISLLVQVVEGDSPTIYFLPILALLAGVCWLVFKAHTLARKHLSDPENRARRD